MLSFCLVSIGANASNIYLVDGDSNRGFIVNLETGAVTTFSPSWPGIRSPVYPIAISNNQLFLSERNGLSAGVFSLAGEFLRSFAYPSNPNFEQLLDGTTDGKRNYAARFGDNMVIAAGLNWENSEFLFGLPIQPAGITYDRRRKSLWVAGYDLILRNYTLTGDVLASFVIPDIGRGLSYDPKTDTLWFYSDRVLYNYSTSGDLIKSLLVPQAIGNIFGGEIIFPFGPGASETLFSMQNNAKALASAFNLQSAKIAQGLSYDCTVYDQKNICVSFVGAKSDGRGFDATTGALGLAHKLTSHVRFGGYIDQSAGSSTSGGLTIKKGSPGYGVFGIWSQNPNGSGVQVRASANQGKVDMETTRSAIETAEAGFGKSDIESSGFQFEVSREYALNSWTARPAIGYRKTTNLRAGYAEQPSDDVTAPLTYSSLKQNTETVLAGVTFRRMLSAKNELTLSAGVEHDLKNRVGIYQAVNEGIGDIDSIDMSANKRNTRPTLSVGFNHNIDKIQRIGASVTHRKEAFDSRSSTSAFVQYSMGF